MLFYGEDLRGQRNAPRTVNSFAHFMPRSRVGKEFAAYLLRNLHNEEEILLLSNSLISRMS
jgi:hypothetical protein